MNKERKAQSLEVSIQKAVALFNQTTTKDLSW